MTNLRVNYAFIDSQNVNLSIQEQGWRLDFARFRTYLKEKYQVERAFIFLGFILKNKPLYTYLSECGFECVFRPTLTKSDGSTKGNCDAELVLQTMIEYPNYDQAVVVTGDGDFHCLVKYLENKEKLKAIIIPNQNKFSALLKYRFCRPYLRFMNDLKEKLGKKEKTL